MMDYREFLPHPALRTIVECYWSLRGNSYNSSTIYPDSCMDVLYDFGQSKAFVVGTMFRPIVSTSSGLTDMFGVRFRAAGMSRIIQMPLFEFNDASPSLTDVGKIAPEIESLRPLTIQERLNMFDRWLLKHIVFSSSKADAWEYCLNTIISRSGKVNVYDLSREVGISQKQMERKFVEKVGPTPKQFAQLLKFRKLREYLSTRRKGSLMDVAYEFEFTDHAHLTKFFKKFGGVTPTEFIKIRSHE
jgi:AraC-like DNA-binding protein